MPSVSIIIPCFNEEATISYLLEAVYSQSYPRSEIEVVIADGFSTDQTRKKIFTFHEQHSDLLIKVIDNPNKTIPSGLNRAIEMVEGEFIIRLDAHSVPNPDYVKRCVLALENDLGENVGGVWEIQPGAATWVAKSISIAAANPLGVGDAMYRVGNRAQVVDTVPFGAFRRSLVDRVGFFDESLLTNEDYEFNARIRQAGGNIWLDPKIRSKYFARPTFKLLSQQYWRYGYWKARMLRKHPKTIRWRQMLPPFFILSMIILGITGFFYPFARYVFLVEGSLYLMLLIIAGSIEAICNKNISLILGVPLAISTMHFSWGSSFLISILSKNGNS